MKKFTYIIASVILLIISFYSCTHSAEDLLTTPVTNPGSGTGTPIPTQTCSSDTTYFQNKVLPLLISSCAKSDCHDAISHQDGIELTSYQKIMSTADVDPGDPDGSKLYRVLNETDIDKIMPRPPSTPLSQAEKNIIYNWILQGAKNNACNDCDTTTITWSAAVFPIINTNCKGCHNPAFLSGGIDLTVYSNVKTIALNGTLIGVIDHQPGYPPMPNGAPKLNDCKITQIKKWIAAGALQN